MNLKTKKILASKALNAGKNRIYFDPERLSEIKEAITKQDIIALNQDGIIKIKPVKGRKTVVKRKRRKGAGKIKMKIRKRKENYVRLTRKLRKYLKGLKQKGAIENDLYWKLRTKIKTNSFKSLFNFKEYISGIGKLEAKTQTNESHNKTNKKSTGGKSK